MLSIHAACYSFSDYRKVQRSPERDARSNVYQAARTLSRLQAQALRTRVAMQSDSDEGAASTPATGGRSNASSETKARKKRKTDNKSPAEKNTSSALQSSGLVSDEEEEGDRIRSDLKN